MKQALVAVLCCAFINLKAQITPLNLIPQPVEVQQSAGSFALTNKTTISYNKAEAKVATDMLIQRINTATGLMLKAQEGKTGMIQLNLNANTQLGKEGYTIEVTPKTVLVSANEAAGLFYGMQTVLQLLPKEIESKSVIKANWTIPAVKITDYPRFAWRGIMLDVSRNFFTKEEVKKYIDNIARFKYNTFHWHLTDDEGWRIEIKSLPKLTEVGAWRVARAGHFGDRDAPKPGEKATVGGYYTQEDIKEVVKYAQERNVTIVPEIDVPGHSMAAIAAYPELSTTKNPNTFVNPGANIADWYGNGTFKLRYENALNPSDEKVYEFLDKVMTEVAALFPNQYIHVGGDECYKGFWAADAGCQALMKKLGIRHVEDLQGYFMNRLEKILEAKGKKLIGWDEILEGGISPNATVMSWRGVKGGIEAAHLGHEVVMTPTTFAYLDYNQGDNSVDPPIYAGLRVSKSYSFEPVPDGVDAKYILGGQGNLWSEQLPTARYADYMTYPRAWALSEVYWSQKSAKNWDNFSKRMEAHFERADVAEINYSKAAYDAIITAKMKDNKLVVELGSEIADLDIYYSIDDSMPDKYSSKYTQPIEMPDGPITLRVITYRAGKPIGHLITLKRAELERRAGK
ncbi:Glycoside hydrolase, family 20, catalytic core [Emticicia oligotrophica DSM 17448]|uniref:beta-N-acetylhexosaminidase n=1 Tax=Emticicia oligotrophica (strain DSM 17448 / CIP 109782 / MTCC 6937 / GPTSA100-15) TaxID=929562 RepID=A0ABM5MZ28_EMTOG|nr:family 20 glycosylhydrolase [Emticicia oligotrophica]AFK02431.1 Glycoside hydrolase, family 20, catalytic core [Emticicia oligotrophica DSM 17448]